ncbi:MICOS complex subunit MIC25 [Pseudolycoriella hygida]|uniref:MICOS complex subunit MIC25 n=1 Tax=Pseudolycoriella hygida TaxID=35572 RepID=A0A9Q0N8Q5_9DIPT|nr:MICOS complex subunit MIC25 [Pseudolycoriella hygida]
MTLTVRLKNFHIFQLQSVMGAGMSGMPRTVTVDNDNPVGVVDISEAVVQRLKNQHSTIQNAEQQYAEKTAVPAQGSSQVPTVTVSPQPTVYYAEPIITALEVRRQKEQELRNNDLYWAKRLAQLEKTLQKTNSILEKEYNAAVDDVRSRFQNASPQHQLPPCKAFKEKLVACYNQHPAETLMCSQQVTEFMQCVDRHRIKVLDENHSVTEPSKTTTPIGA